MLTFFRLPDGTSVHGENLPHIPRKDDYVNIPGVGRGKVKSVEWVVTHDPLKIAASVVRMGSVEIVLKDWKRS
jgi:hypothetical protein